MAEGLVERIFVDGALEMKFNGEKFKREAKLDSHVDAAREVLADFKTHNVVEDFTTVA